MNEQSLVELAKSTGQFFGADIELGIVILLVLVFICGYLIGRTLEQNMVKK